MKVKSQLHSSSQLRSRLYDSFANWSSTVGCPISILTQRGFTCTSNKGALAAHQPNHLIPAAWVEEPPSGDWSLLAGASALLGDSSAMSEAL